MIALLQASVSGRKDAALRLSLVGWLVVVGAVCVDRLDAIEASSLLDGLVWLLGAFVAGNGAEHWAKRGGAT